MSNSTNTTQHGDQPDLPGSAATGNVGGIDAGLREDVAPMVGRIHGSDTSEISSFGVMDADICEKKLDEILLADGQIAAGTSSVADNIQGSAVENADVEQPLTGQESCTSEKTPTPTWEGRYTWVEERSSEEDPVWDVNNAWYESCEWEWGPFEEVTRSEEDTISEDETLQGEEAPARDANAAVQVPTTVQAPAAGDARASGEADAAGVAPATGEAAAGEQPSIQEQLSPKERDSDEEQQDEFYSDEHEYVYDPSSGDERS